MSVRLMEGVIAAAMPTWHPAQFIQRSEDGSWFNARLNQLKQFYTGNTAVVSDEDPIGYWVDHLGNRALLQSSNGLRPRWDTTTNSVEFHMVNNSDPRSMGYAVPDGSLASDQDITLMCRVQSDGVFGKVRGVLGISRFIAGEYYVSLANRHDSSYAGASTYPYTVSDTPRTLLGAFSSTAWVTLSVSRTKISGGKLQNLYIDGVLVASGPSTEIGYTPGTGVIAYIFGPQYDSLNLTQCFRIKDAIFAYKKANPSDHVGYHQYALTLP